MKVSVAVATPSLILTVMVALPDCPVAGVMVIVLFAPLPPRTILAFGTRAVFEEEAETPRLAAGVSKSPTVKLNAEVLIPSAMVWLAISEIVGTSFTALTVSVKVSLTDAVPSLTETVTIAVPN